MNQAEEDYCVLIAQNGQPRGFNLLFRKYQKPLLGFALKIYERQDIATDACQETWIKIAKNIKQLKDPRAFKGWLYKTLKWKMVDLIRQENRHLSDLTIEINQIPQQSEALQNNLNLQQAVQTLASVEKQIIHLFYYEEMSLIEISKILKLATGTIKSRLYRARKQLKKIYTTLEKNNGF